MQTAAEARAAARTIKDASIKSEIDKILAAMDLEVKEAIKRGEFFVTAYYWDNVNNYNRLNTKLKKELEALGYEVSETDLNRDNDGDYDVYHLKISLTLKWENAK